MHRIFILLAGLALLSGCSTASRTNPSSTESFKIVRTQFPGSLWNAAHARASILAQDGGESFSVPGGTLWAYGDTFKGSRSADGMPHFAGGSISTALAFLPAGATNYPPNFTFLVSSNGDAISPFTFLPSEEPVQRYRIWPLGGIYLHGKTYLYYSLIEVFGTGMWDFRGLGSGLACASVPLGPYQRLQPQGDWHFPIEPTQVLAADDWLYLYGIKAFHGKQGVTLARVRPDQIENPAKYEFYTGVGPKFSAQKEVAIPLLENIPGQVSVAWNEYLGKYVLASSSDFSRPREIRLHVADTPTGPWSPPVARLELPAHRQGKPLDSVYCAYLHPELFRDQGRVMILTCSVNLKAAGFDANCEWVEIEIQKTPSE